ncbi:uncharacterized protein [Ptychodera flava]|uniref:uncharacterized protein n=1 Tax=Ptychodera flava TaxID=63121 RepID=UPI00396A67A3
MFRLAVVVIIFATMGFSINADLIKISETEMANMIQGFQREDQRCSTAGHMFCDSIPESCGAGCMGIKECWTRTCNSECTPIDSDPDRAASVCNSLDATVQVLEKGALDLKGASLYQKYVATNLIFSMGFDVCSDGGIVCAEVEDGCVDLDDACNDDDECVCGIGSVVKILDRFLTEEK